MADNEAVSWSEYESHNRNTEYIVRHKIAQELLEHIEILDKQKSPECFIQGIERARNIVLTNISSKFVTEEVDPQEKLF